MRRTVFAGIVGAVLLVAFNSTSAFAAPTTGDTAVPADASSVSTAAPPADATSPTTASAPSAVAPTADASKSAAPALTQAASDVQATALATDVAVEPRPDAPQPPLVDSNGSPFLGTGFAGTPDGAAAVTYGGVSGSGAASSAASWLWDGTSWSRVCDACAPGVRGVSGMATAPTGVVMYGGAVSFGGAALSDAWVFADGAWTQVCASCPPGARFGVAMAGGGESGQVLLFGGATNLSGAPGAIFNDTWGLDGATWTLLDAGVAGDPAPRFGASMAWDGTRFILFGGASADIGGGIGPALDDGTWAWTGDHWTQLCANAAACGPAPRTLPRAAFLDSTDPSRRGVLLVGGFSLVGGAPVALGDIWFWHDGQWIQQVSPWVDQQPLLTPTGPFVIGGGLASLAARCQVSLVGATDAQAGTVSTFNLGLDTNGDGVIDPCPAVPPPTPTPENVVAPAAATAGTGGEATAAGTLPFTGSDLAGPMTFATALLGIGLLLVAASRRTRVRRVASSRGTD